MKTKLFLPLLFFATVAAAQPTDKKNPNQFVPSGFVLLSSVEGDLNKDGGV